VTGVARRTCAPKKSERSQVRCAGEREGGQGAHLNRHKVGGLVTTVRGMPCRKGIAQNGYYSGECGSSSRGRRGGKVEISEKRIELSYISEKLQDHEMVLERGPPGLDVSTTSCHARAPENGHLGKECRYQKNLLGPRDSLLKRNRECALGSATKKTQGKKKGKR